jgi:hypothetical protein
MLPQLAERPARRLERIVDPVRSGETRMSAAPRILSGVVGFPLHGPATVVCFAGSLWVTGPSTGDVVLSAGQRLKIRGEGRVVVEALEPSVIGIEASEEPRSSAWSWLGRVWRHATAA